MYLRNTLKVDLYLQGIGTIDCRSLVAVVGWIKQHRQK